MKHAATAMALLLPVWLTVGCGGDGDNSLDAKLKGLLTGGSATDDVRKFADPDDPDRRREGIEGLAERDFGHEEPYLKGYAMALESDPDPLVRCAAARALGQAGDPKYVPALAAALDDENAAVRWDAAVALDDVRGEEAIGPLQRTALRDESVDVRRSCARALRHYRTPRVLHTLSRALDDPSFTVRYEAHRSLVEMTGRDLGYDSYAWAAEEGADLLAEPPAEPRKPWWDWMGVTGRSAGSAGEDG